jgi:uncharacterized membrane protein YbhN (UPF0104 family)
MRRVKTLIGAAIGFSIFIIALLILHNELRSFNYQDIIRSISGIPQKAIITALLLMFANYGILMIYEIEGFYYIKNPLSRIKIALTSFIAFAFSNNVGFYSISGGAVRYRLYSSWGLSTFDITKIISYCSILAFWLGLGTITGVICCRASVYTFKFTHVSSVN